MNSRPITFFVVFCLLVSSAYSQIKLLNVSYDPTREFYQEYNKLFVAHYQNTTGKVVKIDQSHGGSGKQARSVLDGLAADIVTLALGYDIDILAKKGLVAKDWEKSLPHNSSPYTSTIVFLVRKGNPKGIKDWDDLVKPGVQVITPNPKTSGGARWNYLAAWAYKKNQSHGDEAKVKDFVKSLYKNVPVLDTGARGSTTTFAQRKIGDVLITWENEAYLSKKEFSADQFQIITPSVSILAEPPVALVEKNTNKKGTTEAAREYLRYLYSDEAQDLIGKYYYRPTAEAAIAKYTNQFPKVALATIMDFGGWQKAQKDHFDDGGSFDSIYNP